MSILNFLRPHLLGTSKFGPVKLVVIQPTSLCNLDCDYCYLPDRHLKLDFSLELLEPIFRHLHSSRFVEAEFTVVWHAGEPLTLPVSFYEAAHQTIEHLNQRFSKGLQQINYALQTNATLINQAWCNLFRAYNVRVGVSLDGPAFLHDAHRKTRQGKGTHDATMRGIELLRANEIPFSTIAVLTRGSLEHPDEIFHFFADHRIRAIGFNVDEIEGENKASSLTGEQAEECYRQFMKRLLFLNKEHGYPLEIREFEETRNAILGRMDVDKGQFAPFTIINIAYNGDFTTFSPELLSLPSETYGDFALGNVKNTSFEAACRTEKFKRLNEDIQAGVKLCKQTCQYFNVCGGGAPSNKYFENGTFRSAETLYCRYTKQILTDIVLDDLEMTLGLETLKSPQS
ncbi:MAG: cyclophane-forming radical SAM/SPASM peptide maturase GrrM/OscB [Elainellaceae cyanobacterium]